MSTEETPIQAAASKNTKSMMKILAALFALCGAIVAGKQLAIEDHVCECPELVVTSIVVEDAAVIEGEVAKADESEVLNIQLPEGPTAVTE